MTEPQDAYTYDDSDDIYIPPEPKKDKERFDYSTAQARFNQRKAELDEQRAQEMVEMYEAQMEGRAPALPQAEPEVEVINGIEIPQVTPQEPEYIVERIPVQDASQTSSVVNMPFRSSHMYQNIRKPNPKYVSPEMRARAIEEAKQAVEEVAEQFSLHPEVQVVEPLPPANGTAPMNGTDTMTRVMTIAGQVPNESVIGFEMKNGHLTITFA